MSPNWGDNGPHSHICVYTSYWSVHRISETYCRMRTAQFLWWIRIILNRQARARYLQSAYCHAPISLYKEIQLPRGLCWRKCYGCLYTSIKALTHQCWTVSECDSVMYWQSETADNVIRHSLQHVQTCRSLTRSLLHHLPARLDLPSEQLLGGESESFIYPECLLLGCQLTSWLKVNMCAVSSFSLTWTFTDFLNKQNNKTAHITHICKGA